MANWVAGHTDRFRAIVTHASLWELRGFHGTTDHGPSWEPEFGDPYVDPSRYVGSSPHQHRRTRSARRCWSSTASSTTACPSARRSGCGRTCARHGVAVAVPLLPRREPLGPQAAERAALVRDGAGLPRRARAGPTLGHGPTSSDVGLTGRRAGTDATLAPAVTPAPATRPGAADPMTAPPRRRRAIASSPTSTTPRLVRREDQTDDLATFWVEATRAPHPVRARPVHDHRRLRRRQARAAAVLGRLRAPASPATDGYEFYVRLVPILRFTTLLWRLPIGHRMRMIGPKGKFLLEPRRRPDARVRVAPARASRRSSR